MTSLGSLFQAEDLDQNVASIFGNSTGPIDNKAILAKKKRTIISVVKQGADTQTEEEQPETEEQDRKKQKKKSTENEEEEDDLESEYMSKLLKDDEEEEEEENDDDDEEEEEEDKVQDKGRDNATKSKSAKVLDLKQDELDKAESTIFVGNLSSKLIEDKKLVKRLKKIFSQFGEIKSIRFRSIAFTDNLPRKVALMQKKLNQEIDVVNAYIVFQEKKDSLKSVVLNGTIFEDHHLRVDHLTHPMKQDNQKSIFVGNLDFLEKEESLWKFFELKIGQGEIENVRIIRDSKTNFGKGFAIVQFKDSSNVNKAITMLNDKPLETSEKKRKLRITRCKKMQPRETNNGGNQKKNYTGKESTIIGRGKKILNKSDRTTIGRKTTVAVVEGERAIKRQDTDLKKLTRKPKTKKPRIRERSSNFKKQQQQQDGGGAQKKSFKPRREN